jgi:hypothetical protein
VKEYRANSYHRVSAPKRVWIRTGHKPSNSYFGAAQIYDVIGQEITLSPGDELHNLFGGLFAITNQGTFEVLLRKPSEINMHFCKDYTPRDWRVNQILSTECYEVDKSTARIPTTYNV